MKNCRSLDFCNSDFWKSNLCTLKKRIQDVGNSESNNATMHNKETRQVKNSEREMIDIMTLLG